VFHHYSSNDIILPHHLSSRCLSSLHLITSLQVRRKLLPPLNRPNLTPNTPLSVSSLFFLISQKFNEKASYAWFSITHDDNTCTKKVKREYDVSEREVHDLVRRILKSVERLRNRCGCLYQERRQQGLAMWEEKSNTTKGQHMYIMLHINQ
jgi:hypothetical protein